jgi:type IV pilus assembly protein PilE
MTQSRTRGFSLIEILIVVAVVGILAAIALPAYQEQVRKSRRATAEAHLMDIAAKQQTYLLDSRGSYAGATTCTTAGLTTLGLTTPTDVATFYTVCVSQGAGPPPVFTAQATPTGGQTADSGGLALTITESGIKGPCKNDSTGAYTAAPCASGTTPVW